MGFISEDDDSGLKHGLIEPRSPGPLANTLPTRTMNRYKLATLVEGNLKAPFSIATTPRCRGGNYSIPWIALLYP